MDDRAKYRCGVVYPFVEPVFDVIIGFSSLYHVVDIAKQDIGLLDQIVV